MTWPTITVDTTNLDAGADSPANARADIKQMADNVNAIKDEFANGDGAKLSAIEASATADQTDVEIKTAYENNADTNAFSDTEKSKLGAIEASATADQSDAEIKTAYENNADTNAYTDTDVSTLGSAMQGLVDDTTPQLGGNLDLNGNAVPQSLQSQTGTSYTATITDADKIITMNNAGANTITIPANSSVAYPNGTKLNFMQLGTGTTTVAITTDTLSVNALLTLALNGQYSIASALKVSSTSWVIFGQLVAA